MSKIRACFALNIFQFTSEYIEEIRKLNPSQNFHKEIPEWIYRPDQEDEHKLIENYWFQFTSGVNKSWIMFDVHYKDQYITEEMSNIGEEDFFSKEIPLHKLFDLINITEDYNKRRLFKSEITNFNPASQPYINSQEVFHKALPIPTYIIVDIEYVSSYHYEGGIECDVYYELVGYLDGEFNLVKI